MMVIALLQVRMMKWCMFCYNSMIQSAGQAEYNVFFVLVWSDVLWLWCSEINFLLGKIKSGSYPALTYIRLTANRKSSYGSRKGR